MTFYVTHNKGWSKKTTTKTTTNKKIAPGALTPRATKTLILFYFLMAGVEGLEPPAPGFGDRYFRVMQGKLVAFVLNTAHRLPPIPTQKLQQPTTG